MTAMTADTVAERLAGKRASRTRALLAAAVAGTGTAVVVYKLLRSGDAAD